MSKLRDFFVIILFLVLCLFLALPLIVKAVINGPINSSIDCCSLNVDSIGISYFPIQVSLFDITYDEKSENNPEITSTLKEGVITLRDYDFDKSYGVIDLKLIEPDIVYYDSGRKKVDTEKESIPTYLPLIIKSAKVKKGSIHFSHKEIKGKQVIDFSLIDISLSNWSFRKEDQNHSKFYFTSTLEDNALVRISGKMQPFKTLETMNIDFKLENLNMESINKVLIYYIPVDLSSGTLSVYGELDRNREVNMGYLKIFLENFVILANDQEFVSTKHVFIEYISAVVNFIMQNSNTGNVALKIPFEKSDGEVDFDKSSAFWSSVENMFDSLERGVENKY